MSHMTTVVLGAVHFFFFPQVTGVGGAFVAGLFSESASGGYLCGRLGA